MNISRSTAAAAANRARARARQPQPLPVSLAPCRHPTPALALEAHADPVQPEQVGPRLQVADRERVHILRRDNVSERTTEVGSLAQSTTRRLVLQVAGAGVVGPHDDDDVERERVGEGAQAWGGGKLSEPRNSAAAGGCASSPRRVCTPVRANFTYSVASRPAEASSWSSVARQTGLTHEKYASDGGSVGRPVGRVAPGAWASWSSATTGPPLALTCVGIGSAQRGATPACARAPPRRAARAPGRLRLAREAGREDAVGDQLVAGSQQLAAEEEHGGLGWTSVASVAW